MLRNISHNFVYAAVLLLIFPVLLYLLITPEGLSHGIHDPYTIFLGVSVTVFSALRLIMLSRHCPEKMIATSFYIFAYIWLGLAPIYQLGVGVMPWHIILPVEIYHKTYVLLILAICSFELGYFLSRNSVMRKHDWQEREINEVSIILFSLLAMGLALYLGPISTPLPVLLSFREEIAQQFGDGPSRLVQLSLMRTPIFVAVLALIWRFRTSRQSRLIMGTLLTLAVPLFIIVNFPTAISRAWLGAIVISIVLVIYITSNRNRANYFPLLLATGLLTIFPFFHRFRRANYDQSTGIVDSILETYSRGDFDVFSMSSHFVNYLSAADTFPTYGRQLLGALMFFVPRSLWENKPVGSGYFVAQQSNFQFFNVSAPFWAEGYINFGWFGVVLFMVAIGSLARRLDNRVMRYSTVTLYGLSYAYIAGFLILIMRGDLMTVMVFSAPFLASVVGMVSLSKFFSQIRRY